MHWKYLRYVLRHKWLVFLAGREIGVPLWRLIVHDWSKFLPSEWGPYAAYFSGAERTREVKDRFRRAWSLHLHRQPHHWNHWVLVNDWDDPQIRPLQMPYVLIREMLADWIGAAQAQNNPDVRSWYLRNRPKQHMHPVTRSYLELLMRIHGHLHTEDFITLEEPPHAVDSTPSQTGA